ncbi:MAG TPA: hypothetical protein DCM05_15470 [Elusimicrobia bacterium]|nr:hypothetical protein [Elusimicrobiota bacterium]
MIFEWLPSAKEDYLSLPEAARRKADKAFLLFQKDPRHPSLHVEKIDTVRGIWSLRIDRGYRLTFQWIRGGILIRRMGVHQDAYRRP